MSEHPSKPNSSAIPDQLIQIAHEQEGGAERVISQIEIMQNSFEEIQNLTKASRELIYHQIPPGEAQEALIQMMEDIALHADNGMYNVQGVYDLFQYQDIVRQKLEKIGHRLIEVSRYVLDNLSPSVEAEEHSTPAGRDIMEREAQAPDLAKDGADSVIAEFFAKLKAQKPPTPGA